jgi:hypothetical protein
MGTGLSGLATPGGGAMGMLAILRCVVLVETLVWSGWCDLLGSFFDFSNSCGTLLWSCR